MVESKERESVMLSQANRTKHEGANTMREQINLNHGWFFYPDIEGYELSREGMPYEKGKVVDLPHTVKLLPYHYFNEKDYQFMSLYEKNITVPKNYEEKAVFLVFEGVANTAVVYINGVESFKSGSPYLPFEKDISNELIFGEKNKIEVLVDSRELPGIPPFGGAVDFLVFGGIYREAYLRIQNKFHIDDLFAYGHDVLNAKQKVTMAANFSQDMKGSIVYKLYEGSGLNQEETPCFSSIREVNQRRMRCTMDLENMKLWDVLSPNLYTLEATLIDGQGNAVDQTKVTMGFREAIFKENGFYLNGRKIKITGLNRHQSYPYVGYAMPKSMQELDCEILKNELGVNLVRTSHYPQSKHFLNRCDELGLLVFEEIPGWQHIGDEIFKENSKINLKKMIKRDRNHPSIILWGVRINESADDGPFYKEMNEIAHRLDETRQTGGVRNFAKSEFLEDVYTYNDFIHKGDNVALSQPKEILPEKAPYLVTEFNGHMFPTKSFDSEKRRVEHALRHSRVLEKMMEEPKISGAIGWCMNDYQTHKDFGSGDRICYHGVLDGFRQPKLASYAYSSQGEDEPILMISSSMNIGDRDGGDLEDIYIFTNCDYIELYKNNEFIKKYTPPKSSALKHPPIIIDDLIGEQLEKNEGFSKRDARVIKKVIKAAASQGFNLPLREKAAMGLLLLKNKMTLDDGVALFGKYYAGWGQNQRIYTVKGYRNKEQVIEVERGPVDSITLHIVPSKSDLKNGDTYDVVMVALEARSNLGEVLPYHDEIIAIETQGKIGVLGPSIFPLRGGRSGFYIRSYSGKGMGKVIIHTETLGTHEIEFTVTEQKCRHL